MVSQPVVTLKRAKALALLPGLKSWAPAPEGTRIVDAHGLGEVAAAETGFDLTQPGDAAQTVLAPDTAFVRVENVPLLDVEVYPRVVPDLVVETASPSQSRDGLAGKARAWLQAGVRLVWVVWPKQRVVDVWLPGDEQPHATLGVNGTLDGGDVVPGFSYPVAALFRKVSIAGGW